MLVKTPTTFVSSSFILSIMIVSFFKLYLRLLYAECTLGPELLLLGFLLGWLILACSRLLQLRDSLLVFSQDRLRVAGRARVWLRPT